MAYYIYNKTDFMLSIGDVKKNVHASDGDVEIGMPLRIAPKSWATTKGYAEEDVESSIQKGVLYSSRSKGNVIVCEREEYMELSKSQAQDRLEKDMGISNHKDEPQQQFGFLSKAIKRDTSGVNLSNLIVSDDTDEEPEVMEEVEETEDRISALEKSVGEITSTLAKLTDLIVSNSSSKNVKKKSSTSTKDVKKPVKKVVSKKSKRK